VQLAREEAKRKGQAANLLAAGSMWLFSTDDRTGMCEGTISELVKNLSKEMVKAGEAREPFQLRDLRRTAETMLAKLGTGPNIRGEVQSHGLGGVQKRHYDQHDYLEEKRAALQLWASQLAALKAGTAVVDAGLKRMRRGGIPWRRSMYHCVMAAAISSKRPSHRQRPADSVA
jgi:hypothetical protein